MSDGVTTRRDGHILEVTLDRGKVNAIDVPTSQALAAAFKQLHEDKDLRCAILTGGGEKIFSAGWDLKALNDGEMQLDNWWEACLLYTSPSPRDATLSRMPSSA